MMLEAYKYWENVTSTIWVDIFLKIMLTNHHQKYILINVNVYKTKPVYDTYT